MQSLPPVEARLFYRDRRALTQPEPPPVAEVASCRPRARTARSRCACTGRRGAATTRGAAGARLLPRRRLDHRRPRHARRALPPARQRLGLRGRLGRLPAWDPSIASRPRSTTASPRPTGCVATPTRSASTRRASRSAATAPAATSLPSWRLLARDAGDLPIAFQLLIYPATDMRCGHAVAHSQRPGLPARDRRRSPTTAATTSPTRLERSRLARLAAAAHRPGASCRRRWC